MFDFKNFLKTLRTDLSSAFNELGQNYVEEIIEDGSEFARRFKDRLERRVKKLTSGELSKEEFEWLMKSEKNLIQLKSIEKRGLSEVQLHKIRKTIVHTLIGSVFKSI